MQGRRVRRRKEGWDGPDRNKEATTEKFFRKDRRTKKGILHRLEITRERVVISTYRARMDHFPSTMNVLYSKPQS